MAGETNRKRLLKATTDSTRPREFIKYQTKERNVMSLLAEKTMAHIGKTNDAQNHDHDMIHELSNRLDAMLRYDQYIANAEDDPELQEFWRRLKAQNEDNVEELKDFIAEHVANDCF